MGNGLKVAKWEFKKNIKNKSFLIGLFITPLLLLGFMLLGSLVENTDDGAEKQKTTVFVKDQLGVFSSLQETVQGSGLNWELHRTDIEEKDAPKQLEASDHTAYLFIDDRAIKESVVPVYTSEEMDPYFMDQLKLLEFPIKTLQLKQMGITDEQLALMTAGIVFQNASEKPEASDGEMPGENEEMMRKLVPGAIAGIILLSIVFSGMYIFQSASQEKKDKVAEIILSSVTPGELMQGKIIGYFLLGMVQAAVFLAFAIPIAIWKFEVPVFDYLFVPELILYVILALLGYLLFAALFVGVGATMSDVTTAGNFQGFVLMIPFLPFVFIGPVLSNPEGLAAQIGTYIPFTAPVVLLMRLIALDEWPWLQIGISLVILIVSVWILMKLAGKIFKTGILMYGKNATPKEIWKWIRA